MSDDAHERYLTAAHAMQLTTEQPAVVTLIGQNGDVAVGSMTINGTTHRLITVDEAFLRSTLNTSIEYLEMDKNQDENDLTLAAAFREALTLDSR